MQNFFAPGQTSCVDYYSLEISKHLENRGENQGKGTSFSPVLFCFLSEEDKIVLNFLFTTIGRFNTKGIVQTNTQVKR